MNRFISAFSLLGLMFAFSAHASPPPSLKDNMSTIGKLVKAITLAVNDKTKNATSADQAKQLTLLFTAVLTQEPDSIAQLPQDQQSAALADFKSIINQEVSDSGRLEAAFRTNDNAAAAAILTDMQNGKTTGHDRFKKN